MKNAIIITTTAAILYFNGAIAEDKTDCVVHYTSTACLGQEAVSYKDQTVNSHAQNTRLLIYLKPVKMLL